MGSHSAGRHSRGAETTGEFRRPVPPQSAPAERAPAPGSATPASASASAQWNDLPRRTRSEPRSGWVTSEWSSNPSAGTAPLPRRSPPPRPPILPPGEIDTLTGPISTSSSVRPARAAHTARFSAFEPARPVRPAGSERAVGSERPAGSLFEPMPPSASAAGAGPRPVVVPRQNGTRPGPATGRGAHRAPAPRRAPGRTRLVVAGTASLAGLSAIVTGMALTAETPVISAGPTTGANPLVQADQARDAFGSADTQASRSSSRTELPTPQPTAATGPTASDEGSTPTETDYLQVSRYSSQYHTTQTPAAAQAPSPEQSVPAGSESDDLSGYELPFVPLTPQTTAAATPTNGTDTSDGETSGPTTPGVPTPTPSASASPGQSEPEPTTTPASTPPATSAASGSTTAPSSTATATQRPTTSATSTTPPATTTATQTSDGGSLPFNPDPVEVTPIWDVSIPSITVE